MKRDPRLQPFVDGLMALAGELRVEEGEDGLNLFRVSGAVAHLLQTDGEIKRKRGKGTRGKHGSRNVKAHLVNGVPLTISADRLEEGDK